MSIRAPYPLAPILWPVAASTLPTVYVLMGLKLGDDRLQNSRR